MCALWKGWKAIVERGNQGAHMPQKATITALPGMPAIQLTSRVPFGGINGLRCRSLHSPQFNYQQFWLLWTELHYGPVEKTIWNVHETMNIIRINTESWTNIVVLMCSVSYGACKLFRLVTEDASHFIEVNLNFIHLIAFYSHCCFSIFSLIGKCFQRIPINRSKFL